MTTETPLPLICLPHLSARGNTGALAAAIAEGAAPAARARLIDVAEATPEDWQAMDDADAILFGSPTYMGSTASRFDAFLEEAATRWDTQQWQDKLAGGFTVAMHSGGDKMGALLRLAIFASQMGMIWIGQAEIGAPVKPGNEGINRDGYWLGLAATAARGHGRVLDEGELETARRFGARIATAAARWHAGAPPV